MIAIVDYDTGNLRSVMEALRRAGADFTLTADPATLQSASHVLLPGVGEAAGAMQKLRERGLHTLIPSLSCPVLGICIGMQLMCLASEEGAVSCMGIFPTQVRRLPQQARLKVPHVGWDSLLRPRLPLFAGVPSGSYVYYVHSYAADLCPCTLAETAYGTTFSAALGRANFFGTQFHPEKSGSIGETILKNFLSL